MRNESSRGHKNGPPDRSTDGPHGPGDAAAEQSEEEATRGCSGSGPSSESNTPPSDKNTGKTRACPECDSTHIQSRAATHGWRCRQCSAVFAEPVEHETQAPNAGRRSPGIAALKDADPEAVSANGDTLIGDGDSA